MTRILVQRGSGSSSSNPSRPAQPPPSQSGSSTPKEEERDDNKQESIVLDVLLPPSSTSDNKAASKCEDVSPESSQHVTREAALGSYVETGISSNDLVKDSGVLLKELDAQSLQEDAEGSYTGTSQVATGGSYPPPPPVPPPMPSGSCLGPRRTNSGGSNTVRIGPSRRQSGWSVTRNTDSRPSSPKSFSEADGYNSADEQIPCLVPTYDDVERERLFEIEIKRAKGFEVKRMIEDGNCLFRAIADQVYGDPEAYDMARQMCIDYMEKERDHFSQFITESFASYCKRKRRDKVYGNNLEIQAFAEMFNRPIHIYSYSLEPLNIFHGGYSTDTPPIRLSYHHGNHYNSLVDPRRLTIGAGLGLSSLQGVANVDKDLVKAAIKAQQDQQIDNALLAEGRFYSDLELTEKEIERMVMEASRAEYIAQDRSRHQQLDFRDVSKSAAEPSSSGARSSRNADGRERVISNSVLSDSMQIVLAMGFSYLQAIEAYSIFGDDVDSMVCYLVEMGGVGGSPGRSRQKGKIPE